MAQNSAAQYEVVAVGDEDGVHWRRWRRRQRSTALKFKAGCYENRVLWYLLTVIIYHSHVMTL